MGVGQKDLEAQLPDKRERGSKEDFDDHIFFLTKDHVELRVEVERLPAEFRSRNQLAFAANLQIRIPIVLDVSVRVSRMYRIASS